MRSDPKCLLMAPTEMSFGFVAAMLNGWVNGVAVKEGIGKQVGAMKLPAVGAAVAAQP